LARRGEKYWEHSFTEEPRRRPIGPPCPSRCNIRWRQLVKEPLDAFGKAMKAWQEDPAGMPPEEPEVPDLRPWPGDPVLCQRCQSQVKTELAELADLADIMEMENTGHRHGPDADRVSGSRHAPSPSPVADDLDELASVLRDWQAVALEMGDTPARTGFLLSEVGTLCARLAGRYFPKLANNPDVAASFAEEISQWHRRFTAQAKAGTGLHHKREPCPRCGRYSLTWRDGDTYVACSARECARMLSLDEFRAYSESLAAGRPPGVASLGRGWQRRSQGTKLPA